MRARESLQRSLANDKNIVRTSVMARFVELLHPDHPDSSSLVQSPEALIFFTAECPESITATAKFLGLGNRGERHLKTWLILHHGRHLGVDE